MRAIPLLLSGGTGSAALVTAEALAALQSTTIDPTTGVPFEVAVQLGFLLTAVGTLIYAGRVVGRWEASQKTLIKSVKEIDPLKERVALVEGMLKMLDQRTRRPFTEEGSEERLEA